MSMDRRQALGTTLAALVGLRIAPSAAQDSAAPPSLAMVGFELIDEQRDESQRLQLDRRLASIDRQFRLAVQAADLYRVVEVAPAAPQIAKLRDDVEYLYRCNGCLAPIGRRLGAAYIAAGWVQKVSNLILNINVQIRDTARDRIVLTKSVDVRSNTDESWSRGIAYLVRDMTEKRADDPRYGL